MKPTILIIVTLISLSSCNPVSTSKGSTTDNIIDSLNQKITSLNDEIKLDQKLYPHIQLRSYEGGVCAINLYIPWGLNLSLVSKRPVISNETFLIVPAAYTSKYLGIDGLFIENGKAINPTINNKLNGACVITSNGLKIVPFDTIQAKKTASNINIESLFQQSLLIYNSKVVKCDIFGNKQSLRRALIQFENLTCIGESHRPLTIQEFQEALINIGAKNAINLDMGSWSEGMFKNSFCEIKMLGDNFANTKNQTSWLTYSRQ